MRIVFAVACALVAAATALPAPAQGVYGGVEVMHTVQADLSKSNGFVSFSGHEGSGLDASTSPEATPYQADDFGCFILRINSTMRGACGRLNINIVQPLSAATVTGSINGCSVNISISVAPTVAEPPEPGAGEGLEIGAFGGWGDAHAGLARGGGTATGSWSCSGVGTISGGSGTGALGVAVDVDLGYYT